MGTFSPRRCSGLPSGPGKPPNPAALGTSPDSHPPHPSGDDHLHCPETTALSGTSMRQCHVGTPPRAETGPPYRRPEPRGTASVHASDLSAGVDQDHPPLSHRRPAPPPVPYRFHQRRRADTSIPSSRTPRFRRAPRSNKFAGSILTWTLPLRPGAHADSRCIPLTHDAQLPRSHRRGIGALPAPRSIAILGILPRGASGVGAACRG
ncbi:hypothetical protein QBC39DRAFT_166968 [Podospora conica]|nr:hypothetical protein QBC39DRAFT_166968 [Schizothecium conicum]